MDVDPIIISVTSDDHNQYSCSVCTCTHSRVHASTITVELSNRYTSMVKINNKLLPLKIGSSDASREMIKYAQTIRSQYIF